MAQAMEKMGIPDAAEKIYETLLSLGNGKERAPSAGA